MQNVTGATSRQCGPEPWHGTEGGYSNHRCRGDECRRVHAEYRRSRRAQRRNQPTPPTVQHGTPSTYENWACRCSECVEAKAEKSADYVKRRSVAS